MAIEKDSLTGNVIQIRMMERELELK